MIINFDTPKVIQPSIGGSTEVTSSFVTLKHINDWPDKKIVCAHFLEIPKQHFNIWSGSAYDDIGDWTQDQSITAIAQTFDITLFKNN
jgi:hypothetical protein